MDTGVSINNTCCSESAKYGLLLFSLQLLFPLGGLVVSEGKPILTGG